MVRILVLQGHPHAGKGHLCHALADAYAGEAEVAGHRVTRLDVAAQSFNVLRDPAEFREAVTAPDILAAQNALMNAEHILLVYPLWLGTMPALLKAFLEQVLRPGFAFDYLPKGRIRKRLSGRSCRIVVTMGMPSLVYRWFFRAHSVKSLERNILKFVGIGPVRETLFGMVEAVAPRRRARWIEKMRALGRRAA